MTSEFGVHLSVILLTLAAVMAAVGLHYEGLSWLARRLAQGKGPHRRRVLRAAVPPSATVRGGRISSRSRSIHQRQASISLASGD